ncbi:hypothetical protein [Hydrogenophaga sp.]|uniref:hypothetical protein n=1 Tax=Hydrogenophaga sp. TaxID=1904254 RepID=UPI00286EB026|nr:hypothetical protein [Hydrogenophaga sp.]
MQMNQDASHPDPSSIRATEAARVDISALPEFFRRDDPRRLNSMAVKTLRGYLLCEIGPLHHPATARFVDSFLSDDLLVESYFQPLVRQDPVGLAFQRGGRRLEALPWVEAKRAAEKARRSHALQKLPKDQELAYIAAWACPAGIFHLSHPSVQAQGRELEDLVQARDMTAELVDCAIKAMLSVSAVQGRAMRALIGDGGNEGCKARQLGRLGTALHLSQLRLNEFWIPATGWFCTDPDDRHE